MKRAVRILHDMFLAASTAAALWAMAPACHAGENGWTFLGPETVSYPQRILVDPEDSFVLYLSVGPSGAYKTIDGGAHWTHVDGGMETGTGVQAIFQQAGAPPTLFAATDRGVYRSADGAGTWSKVAADRFSDIAGDPHHPATLYGAETFAGVRKSLDGGATWTQTGLDMGADRILFDPVTPGILYVAGGAFLVSKSSDGGDTWADLGAGFPSGSSVNALALAPLAPSILFAGTDRGLFRSADGGASWTPSNDGLSVDGTTLLRIHDLATESESPDVVYAATDSGVFRSSDGAGTWVQMTLDGFPGASSQTVVTALATDPGDPAVLFAGIRPHGLYSHTQLVQEVDPPVVESVRKRRDPFRLVIDGANFHDGLTVTVGSASSPWSKVRVVGPARIKLKGAKALKAWFPKGEEVPILIRNPDGGEVVTSFTR